MMRSREKRIRSERQEKIERHTRSAKSIRRLWLQLVIGVSLIGASARFLLWSEERLLRKTLSLDEGLHGLVSVDNANDISAKNNDKLVHVVGRLEVGEPLTEFDYGVSVPAIKLKRRVQMYQWVEEFSSRDVDDLEFEPPPDTLAPAKYFYYTEWKDKLIDSNTFEHPFGHENPKQFPLKTTTYVSEHVNIGGYYFGDALKAKCTDFTLVTSDERPERKDIKLHSGLYYHSQDVWNPEVGDIRVQFSYCGFAGDEMTVIAKQQGHELQPYVTQAGHEILIIEQGRSSVGDIFYAEHKHNRFIPWCARIASGIFTFIGSSYVTRHLKELSRRRRMNPTLRLLLADNSRSINLSISITVCFTIIAFTWLQFRPMLCSLLFVSATIPVLFIIYLVYTYYLDNTLKPSTNPTNYNSI